MRAVVLASTMGLISAGAMAAPFPVETEAGGCRVERLAGGDGVSYTQFFGASPDGRQIVLGQEKVQPGGTLRALPSFLLDLETGARTTLPSLNNAATFSPDGRTLVAGIYTGSRLLRTEIVEYDLETKLMKFAF